MKFRWKVLIAIVIVVLTAAGAGLWYLQSDSFQKLVQDRLCSRLEEATGTACRMDAFELHILGGRFVLSGLELGQGPDSSHSLHLRIKEIRGTFQLRSLWRPQIKLVEMYLVHPRLELQIRGDSRPVDLEQVSRAVRRSLELAVSKVTIQEGWLDLNNRRIPLNLSVRDVILEIRYRDTPMGYKLRLAYRNGRVAWTKRELAYDLDARLTLSQGGLDIESLEVRRNNSFLRGEGWMRDWRSPAVLLHANGKLAADALSVFHSALSHGRGDIQVTGNFRWDAGGFHSMGKFSAQAASYRQVVVDTLDGLFEMKDDALLLTEVKGQIGPGNFQAEGAFQLKSGAQGPHRLKVSAKRLDLQNVAKILNLPSLAFENTVDSESELIWSEGIQDLVVSSKVKLHGLPDGAATESTKQMAFGGDVEFTFARRTLFVSSANLRSPHTAVKASGLGGDRLQVSMKTDQISEPLNLLSRFSEDLRRLLQKYPDLMEATGSYELDGDLKVSASRISYQGQVGIQWGRWRTYSADTLVATASWDGEGLELHRFQLGRGTEVVDGNFGIAFPTPEGELPDLFFRGSVRNVSMTSLKDVGLQFDGQPQGTLSGNGTFSRTQGSWKAGGEFSIQKGSLYDETFDVLRGRMQLTDRVLQIADCLVSRGMASLTIQGRIGLDSQDMNLSVGLKGLRLGDLPALRDKKFDIDGRISASGEVHGLPENPTVKGSFELEGVRYESHQLGRGKGSLDLKNKKLQAALTVASELGTFDTQAQISTESGYAGKVRLQIRDWNVRRFIPGDFPPYLRELSTALEGSLEIEGQFADPSTLTYRGEMDGASFKIHDYELRNSDKIRFVASGNKVQLEQSKVLGEGSRLTLSGVIPLDGSATLNLRLTGVLNLMFLQHAETKLGIAGAATMDVHATGTLGNPLIIGQAILNNCRFDHTDLPFNFSSVFGVITFSRHLVRLENVRGNAASGNVQVNGVLEHQDARLRGINVQISARGARLAYPQDFRTSLDADLNLRGSGDSQVLTGDVRISRAEYIREFNLLEQLAGRTPGTRTPDVTEPFLAGLRLNISIRSDSGLVMDNELIRMQGRIGLTLRGTPAYPSLTGRVEATEGTIFFRGSRFEIIRASADFVDRNRINPVFEIRAESDVKSYRLLLDVNGDLDNLRSSIRSDPPLATMDIFNLLATGKAREGVERSGRQAEITGVSAASILSDSLTGVIGKRVQRLFGFETFRVDPFLAGAQNDPTARITISQRLSKDLIITYSTNLSTSEDQIVVVEYDVNKNLSIIATRDEDGKFGLDLRFRKRFR